MMWKPGHKLTCHVNGAFLPMTIMSNYFDQSRFLRKATPSNSTAVDAFRRYINRKHDRHLENYHDLHAYSVSDYVFWIDLWEFMQVISSVPPDPRQVTAEGRIPEVPIWFPGARLNYAENLLARRDDGIAVTTGGESGVVADYSFRTLREMVREMAAALRVNGLRVGDRVAAIVRNSITAIVLALATASVGGIFSSTATDMGTQGILDRYEQISPKFVFAETEVLYAGKVIDLVPKVLDVFAKLKHHGMEHGIVLPSAITGKEPTAVAGGISLSSFLASGDRRELEFEQLPFSQPLFILYSSGTSGPPKCIVHCAGGAIMSCKKDVHLAFDLRQGDTLLQYTSTGWIMWVLHLTTLSIGSRVICYDGSPLHPTPQSFLKFISDQNVTLLGTSPRWMTELQGRGINPCKYNLRVNSNGTDATYLVEVAKFEALRAILCTGSVLTPPMFTWAHNAFGGERVHLLSTSGGTDICGSFVTGSPSLPSYAGEIQAKGLGMKIEIFSPSGENIEDTGEPGELVCTRAHPTVPLYFWGDTPDGKKLKETYYSTFPGVWRQGDFMVKNRRTGGLMILGRSDGVLNPSGVRFGSAEIYTALETFTSVVEDSLCVGQRRKEDSDERVLLFIKMREGNAFTKELVKDIKQTIRQKMSPRHVPSFYTVNGKKIEIAVKQIVSGSTLKPSGTVANPESLKLYYKYANLEEVVKNERTAKL
ncbi:acetoacetyl-CoA synthetase [Hymenopellis radicata]|nr:acetoacetyl-CoA synthetase [Hymenopellis radicata]